jgi:hypothetical protein
MKQIKFRARNAKFPSCWIYGYFAIENGVSYIVNDEGKFPVICGTECQYTGLNDKNGKEIYVGDAIEHNNRIFFIVDSDVFGIVAVMKNKNLGNVLKDGLIMTSHNYRERDWILNCAKYIKVVGNIYENPELKEE